MAAEGGHEEEGRGRGARKGHGSPRSRQTGQHQLSEGLTFPDRGAIKQDRECPG